MLYSIVFHFHHTTKPFFFLSGKGTNELHFSYQVEYHSVSDTDAWSTYENSYGAFAYTEILLFNLLSDEFILGQVSQLRNYAIVILRSAGVAVFSLSLLLGVLFVYFNFPEGPN